LTTFESWGTPPPSEPLYLIAASETLPNDRAWAEVIQFRSGQFFRQMRFYRLAEDRSSWLRTPPLSDAAIWGGVRASLNSSMRMPAMRWGAGACRLLAATSHWP
jgi:hypothetical protein